MSPRRPRPPWWNPLAWADILESILKWTTNTTASDIGRHLSSHLRMHDCFRNLETSENPSKISCFETQLVTMVFLARWCFSSCIARNEKMTITFQNNKQQKYLVRQTGALEGPVAVEQQNSYKGCQLLNMRVWKIICFRRPEHHMDKGKILSLLSLACPLMSTDSSGTVSEWWCPPTRKCSGSFGGNSSGGSSFSGCGMWGLSSPTRDWTCAPCTGKVES